MVQKAPRACADNIWVLSWTSLEGPRIPPQTRHCQSTKELPLLAPSLSAELSHAGQPGGLAKIAWRQRPETSLGFLPPTSTPQAVISPKLQPPRCPSDGQFNHPNCVHVCVVGVSSWECGGVNTPYTQHTDPAPLPGRHPHASGRHPAE